MYICLYRKILTIFFEYFKNHTLGYVQQVAKISILYLESLQTIIWLFSDTANVIQNVS